MRRDADPTPLRPRHRLLPVPRGRGRRRLRDPGRPGPRRPHRAGALPVLRGRRDHPADEGPTVVRAPRRREALRGPHARPTGIELAERISGDTAVGHTLAYVLAVEDAARHRGRPSRTRLSAPCCSSSSACTTTSTTWAPLANDVGYGIANAHAQRLREHLLRHNKATHRAPAAARGDHRRRRPHRARPRPRPGRRTAGEVAEIVAITLGHTIVRRPVHRDGRAHHRAGGAHRAPSATSPAPPASTSTPAATTRSSTSGRLSRRCSRRPATCWRASRCGPREVAAVGRPDRGPERPDRPGRGQRRPLTLTPPTSGHAPGSESSRRGGGRWSTASSSTDSGRLARVKVVDPSFFNWPALPVALTDTIVPDFPLANKSFNQSYAGNDL